MPKKGGKKHNKKKGAGGGGAKVPDVKNIISPGHKEEDQLLYGEGTAAEATTEAGPATASGSAAAEAAAPAATVAETQAASAQDITKTEPTAAVLETEETLPVREKDFVPIEATKEQRGERTEALAAAAPIGSTAGAPKEAPKEVTKETTITKSELERPSTSHSTERADLVAATQGKAEPAARTTTGVPEAIPEVTKKEQVPTDETTGPLTAGGAAAVGATALAGVKAEEGRTQPAPSAVNRAEAAKETPPQLAEEKSQGTGVATAAPLVAPHIKRAHEVPAFVTEERDQPSKKPRVDEPVEDQQKMAIPGRFPSPSVAGSTASGADSAIAPEAQNISKGETVTGKPETAGTVTAAASTQPVSTKGPTEATVAAPAAGPVTSRDTKAEQISTADTGAGAGTTISAASPAGDISAQREPALPVTPQKVDTTAKPTSPAAAAAAAAFRAQPTSEQQQKQQEAATTRTAEEVTHSKQTQQAPAQKEAKKGGFIAWIKRKFKGEKPTTATTNGNGH